MADLRISIQEVSPEIARVFDKIDPTKSFPNLLQALNEVAELYKETWIGFASGVPIPGIPRVINSRGTYKNSIKVSLDSPEEKIIYSDSIINKYIEDGSGPVDLKEGLLKGPKARFGKNGPYNIVSFRHGAPGTVESNQPMPLTIFNLTRNATKQATRAQKKSGSFEVVSQENLYGIRSKRVESYMPGKGNYTWKSGQFAGMRRQDTSTGKASRSSYITFRTVSIHSDPASWIRPPQQPIPIRQEVVNTAHDIAERMLKDALEEDLK